MSERIWKIEWNDGMSYGNPEIDAEHKHFADLVNRFNETVAGRMEIAAVVKAISDILEYVEYHFPGEEKLYQTVGYPEAEAHKQKHDKLRTLMKKTLADAKGEAADYTLIEAGLNIKEQIIEHLLTDDLKYVEYCRKS